MMNVVEIKKVKEISELLNTVKKGKVENLPELKQAIDIVDDLLEFKDFDRWKMYQD